MTPSRRSGWLAALLALACVGLIIRHGSVGKSAPAKSGGATTVAAVAPSPAHLGSTPTEEQAGAFVREPKLVLQQGSLRDTAVDGDVATNLSGQLKPDLGLRHLFDYYLSLNGETDLAGIRKLLHRDLCRRQLAMPTVDEAMQTFDRYVRYQHAAVALAQQPGQSLDDAFAALDALRRQMLGERVAEAFFGAEQSRQQAVLQRLQIASSRELSPAQKALQLQSLEATRPPAEREVRAQARMGHLVQQQTELLDEAHADTATRHAERAQIWGDQAADRLAQLDRRRAQWAERLRTYAARSQHIRDNDALDSGARQSALQALLQSSFDSHERLQVQAMARSGLLATRTR